MKSKKQSIWVAALLALATVFNLNFNPVFAADSTTTVPSVGPVTFEPGGGGPVTVPVGPDYAGLMEMLRSPEVFETYMYSAVRDAYMGISSGTMVAPGQGGTQRHVGHWEKPQPMSDVLKDLRQIVRVQVLDTREPAGVWMQLNNSRGKPLFSGAVYEYLQVQAGDVYSLGRDVVLEPQFYNYWEPGDQVSGVEYIPGKDAPNGSYRRSLDRDEDGSILVPWVLSQQSGTLVFYSSKHGVAPVAFDLRSGKQVPLSAIIIDSGHALVSGFRTVHGSGVVDYLVVKSENDYDVMPKFEWSFGAEDQKRIIRVTVMLSNGIVPYAYSVRATDDLGPGVTIEVSSGRLELEFEATGKTPAKSYYIVPIFRPGEVSRRPGDWWWDKDGGGKG